MGNQKPKIPFTHKHYDNTKFDGICGMGLDDIATDGVTTPLRALANSKALDANVFAFYLGHNSPGQLVIGGVDDTKYTGDFTYHAVREMVPGKTGYWEVAMDDFQINGVTVIQSKKGVIATLQAQTWTSSLEARRTPSRRRTISSMMQASACWAQPALTSLHQLDLW